MKIYSYNLENIKIIDSYIKKIKNLSITTTSYSIIIKTHSEKIVFAKSYLGYGAMKIIIDTRIDVLNQMKEKRFKLKEVKPEFFNYNRKNFESVESKFFYVSEIDLNSAYLESAFYQNIISEKMYLKLKSISKPIRLRALGSLATIKNISYYENGNFIYSEQKSDKNLRAVWNMICKGTDELIYSIIETDSRRYLFYWFDNLFINGRYKHRNELYKVKYPIEISYEKSTHLKIMAGKRLFVLPI